MRSILAAVGRTPKSDGCLDVAARIASDTGSVLHVVRPLGPAGGSGGWPGDRDVLAEQIHRRIPSGVAVGSVQVVAQATHEAILEGVRESGADLVVASPQGTAAVWMDPALAQVVLRASPAVLVVREPVRWPPKRALVPLLPGTAIDATLRRVGAWARTLGTAGDDGSALGEIRLLHVPGDVGDLHRGSALLEREMERLREDVPAGAVVRLVTSVRWGAKPLLRIARSREMERADLLVLDRADAGPVPAAGSRFQWFHLLASASSSALLLPRDRPAVRPDPGPGRVEAAARSLSAGGAELPGKPVPMLAAP